jgi:hypothetical protein
MLTFFRFTTLSSSLPNALPSLKRTYTKQAGTALKTTKPEIFEKFYLLGYNAV